MKFSLSQVKQALGEVQTLLHWTFNIANPPKGMNFPEKLMIRVTTTDIPKPERENTAVELGGFNINYVGKVKRSGSITVTFFEGTDGSVTEFIQKWVQACWSSDGKDTAGTQGLTSDVKADITLSLMGPNDKVTQTYKLIGCLPNLGDTGGQLGQTADAMKPQLTLDYDDFHWGLGEATTI